MSRNRTKKLNYPKHIRRFNNSAKFAIHTHTHNYFTKFTCEILRTWYPRFINAFFALFLRGYVHCLIFAIIFSNGTWRICQRVRPKVSFFSSVNLVLIKSLSTHSATQKYCLLSQRKSVKRFLSGFGFSHAATVVQYYSTNSNTEVPNKWFQNDFLDLLISGPADSNSALVEFIPNRRYRDC